MCIGLYKVVTKQRVIKLKERGPKTRIALDAKAHA